jgi:hypothetical protein
VRLKWIRRKRFVSEFQILFSHISMAEEQVFKGRHFDRSVILLCVRWYLAYNLSLQNLEEMMASATSRSITPPFTGGLSATRLPFGPLQLT